MVLQSVPAHASASRPVQIFADIVTALDHGQVLEARGRVVITDGRITLRADRVLYNRTTGRIRLAGHVRVTTPQGALQAGEAAARLTRTGALAAIEASGGVTARSGDRVLTADRVRYQPMDETLIASGRVVLASSALTITAAELVAKGDDAAVATGRPRIQHRDGFIEGDRLDAAIRAQIGFIRGNVVGVFSETRITAASATLLAKENKAVFRDNVTVTRPDRTMTAALVTYYYAEKRLVAEGQTTITIRETPP